MTVKGKKSEDGKSLEVTITEGTLEELEKITKDYKLKHESSALVFAVQSVAACNGNPVTVGYDINIKNATPSPSMLKKEGDK